MEERLMMRRRLRIKFAFTRLFSAIMFMLSLGLFGRIPNHLKE